MRVKLRKGLLVLVVLCLLSCNVYGSDGPIEYHRDDNDTTERSVTALQQEMESLFSADYFRLLFEDTRYVLAAPATWEKKQWTIFSLTVLGVGMVSLLDKPVWDMFRRNHRRTANNVSHIMSDATGISGAVLLVPFYIAGQTMGNPKATNVALDAWAATLASAGVISPAVKFLVGRSIPSENKGAYRFSPFTYRFQLNGGPQSFPSGHAMQDFAIASVVSFHYREPWVRATAYSLAALASASRLYHGDHFLSDSLTGALIGTLVGTSIAAFNDKRRKERREGAISLGPLLCSGVIGLNLTIHTD